LNEEVPLLKFGQNLVQAICNAQGC
jgi:hypothetical protein